MVKLDETNIVEFINQGKDKEVIKYLYQRVFPMVKKYLLKKGARKEDVEDVFQDSVMTFYKMTIEKKIASDLNVSGLLYTISVNKWFNLMRKNNRQVVVDFQENESYQFIPDEIRELVLVKTEKNLLNSLFSQIGDKCIQLLTFTIYQDLMIEDIQERMGFSSEAAAKMQVKRCREKLYEQLDKNPTLLNRLFDYV